MSIYADGCSGSENYQLALRENPIQPASYAEYLESGQVTTIEENYVREMTDLGCTPAEIDASRWKYFHDTQLTQEIQYLRKVGESTKMDKGTKIAKAINFLFLISLANDLLKGESALLSVLLLIGSEMAFRTSRVLGRKGGFSGIRVKDFLYTNRLGDVFDKEATKLLGSQDLKDQSKLDAFSKKYNLRPGVLELLVQAREKYGMNFPELTAMRQSLIGPEQNNNLPAIEGSVE